MRFSIKNGELYLNGDRVGDSINSPGFQDYKFIRPIGEGANGIAFIAKHRFLESEQVIKIYYDKHNRGNKFFLKSELETKKNANFGISNIIATVHNAGTYLYPQKILYSIMESVPHIVTLRDAINIVDNTYNKTKHEIEHDDSNTAEEKQKYFGINHHEILSVNLNICMTFLLTVHRLHKKGIIHGDLNGGNILLGDDLFEDKREFIYTDGIEREVTTQILKRDNINPGTLNLISMRLIDLGSSDFSKLATKKQNLDISSMRESWFIYNNCKELLKYLFNSDNIYKGLDDFLSISVGGKIGKTQCRKLTYKTNTGERPVSPERFTGELMRMILLINFLHGNIAAYNPDRIIGFQHFDDRLSREDLTDFNQVIFDPGISSYMNGVDTEINREINPSIDSINYLPPGSFINWQNIWDYFSRFDSRFQNYTVGTDRIQRQQY